MNCEEAEKILEVNEGSYLRSDSRDKIFDGLKILKKYEKEIIIAADHDILYLNDFNEKITKEDLLKLYKLGFHIDSEAECWALFT